jgi:hypothetical protein
MKVFTKTNRIITSGQALAALDELARENNIVGQHCYDEAAARSLSEFDAMQWRTLCAQRKALIEREAPEREKEVVVPRRFLCIYETKECAVRVSLENTESLSEIAA